MDPTAALENTKQPELLPLGQYIPQGRSVLATNLFQLSPKIRATLLVNDYAVAFIDTIVTVAAIFTDDKDGRPFAQRFNESEFAITGMNEDWVINGLEYVEETIEDWVKKFRSPSYRKYLNRLLGADKYDRLVKSFQKDSLVILTALRRGTKWFMPFAVALQDCIAIFGSKHLEEIPFPNASKPAIVSSLVKIDALIGMLLDGGVTSQTPLDADNKFLPDEDEIEQLTNDLRVLISSQSNDDIQEINSFLARKLQGARDALAYSADGVSQAANSIIELIDRLARAFSQEVVVDWVDNQLSNSNDLVRIDGNRRTPNKRAQLLYLAYGGGLVPDPSEPSFNKIVAIDLFVIRENLQKFKHSDSGSADEKERLLALLAAAEGAICLLVRMCWAMSGQSKMHAIRNAI